MWLEGRVKARLARDEDGEVPSSKTVIQENIPPSTTHRAVNMPTVPERDRTRGTLCIDAYGPEEETYGKAKRPFSQTFPKHRALRLCLLLLLLRLQRLLHLSELQPHRRPPETEVRPRQEQPLSGTGRSDSL
ncbi:hypothetical protein E5288_WYG018071 [Bos mutus]|uniref:Uncharacterized protein n=1 Tax=Bos mutus TaxID=72004 RepID=A0A6B0RC79_9CETA|nr:hypothetical protein [Bos mutus]